MPVIETERLILRPFTLADLDDYHTQVYGDPDVTRFLPGGRPRPKDRSQIVLEYSIEHGRQHGFTLWAVVTKAEQQFLGHCGLIYLQDSPEVEIAYAIGKAFWRQGYTTEAARASLRYGFESAGLEDVIALAVPDNIASQRVMRKIGMTYQGLTNRYYNTELALYALSGADFRPDASLYSVVEQP